MKRINKRIQIKMQKSVHRDLLLKSGQLFPMEKVHIPKNAYKRTKLRTFDLINMDD
jgi:hypothetical protein